MSVLKAGKVRDLHWNAMTKLETGFFCRVPYIRILCGYTACKMRSSELSNICCNKIKNVYERSGFLLNDSEF